MRDRLLLILLFSYDLLTYINIGLGSVTIKVIYYGGILGLFLSKIIITDKNKKITLSKDSYYIVQFVLIVLYIMRVIFDLYASHIHHAIYENSYTYIFILFNSVIVPFIFVRSIDFRTMNFLKFSNEFQIILFAALACSFYRLYTIDVATIVGGRVSANESLDPIAYGHLGLTLFLLSFAKLLNTKRLGLRILNIVTMLFGLLSIGLANSRSPLVALLFITIVYIVSSKRFRLVGYSLIAVSLVLIFLERINIFLISKGSYFVDRILLSFHGGDINKISGDRVNLFREGLFKIRASPILGSSFVSNTGVPYHNAIVEVFVALGIFGGGLFLLMLLTAIYRAFVLMKSNTNYVFFIFIFLQSLIYIMFSRSLVSMPLFWTSLFVVTAMYSKRIYRVSYICN